MIHVGLDLHHRTSYVRAMDDHGEVFPGRRVHHTVMSHLEQYLAGFGSEPKRVVFEATANARWMYRWLAQRPGVEPVAVTPHKVRIIAETVAKTDQIDALVLATLSRIDMLPRAYVPDETVEALREQTRYRAALVRLRTRAKNQINGVLVRCGVVRPYGNIFGVLGLAWLAGLDLPAILRQEVQGWLRLIETLQERIEAAERVLYRELARQGRWAADVDLLVTMPGVGKLTALTILAELGDYWRFRRRSAVSAFAGLVPTSKRSDRTARYGRLTKRGSTALRSILVEVAINAQRRVPRYRDLYERLKAAKSGNVGKVAVARQMLEDAWTMLIKREPFRFDPGRPGNATRAG